MNCTIEINNLRIYAHHGVMPQEKIVGNTFEVTVHLTYHVNDNSFADDNINGTINYAEVTDIVRNEMITPSQLLEHVASRIRQALMQKFQMVTTGYVRVAKLTPPIPAQMQSAAVAISW